jgi:hypothetical protein
MPGVVDMMHNVVNVVMMPMMGDGMFGLLGLSGERQGKSGDEREGGEETHEVGPWVSSVEAGAICPDP